MKIFERKKTRAEISRINALNATKVYIQKTIDMVAKNGHFSHYMTIRKGYGDGRDLAQDVVSVLQSEFEKDGYTTSIENDTLIIKW